LRFVFPIRPARVSAAQLLANVHAAFGIKGALANTLPIDDPRVRFWIESATPIGSGAPD
jgi:hypothetical protein